MRSLTLRNRRLIAPTAVTDSGAGGMGILESIPSYYQTEQLRYRPKRVLEALLSIGANRQELDEQRFAAQHPEMMSELPTMEVGHGGGAGAAQHEAVPLRWGTAIR